MSLALYRKYRPQTFGDLIGQNHIKTTLKNELETNTVAHAYLFSGPRGLGKTTTARLLAKAINCQQRAATASEPCNACTACKEITSGTTLDVLEIDAASHTGVDNVRDNIINSARFTPSALKYKVFIIDEVHMLSISAFNALLKTLEEPPAHVIFILATTEIYKVPQTIISRCQHFDFRKVSQQELMGRLVDLVTREGKRVDQKVLTDVARAAEGSVRDAESLLGQILSLDEKNITAEQAELVLPRSRFDAVIQIIDFTFKNDAANALTLINQLLEEGVDLEKFCSDTIEVLRLAVLIKVSSRLGDYMQHIGAENRKALTAVSERVALARLITSIDILIRRRQEMRNAEIIQLPLELAVLEIINGDSSHTDSSTDTTSPKPPMAPPALKKSVATEIVEKPEAQSKKDSSVAKKSIVTSVGIDVVKKKWHDVLIALRKYNASLASALKISQPVDMREGVLTLAASHQFHQQRIVETKNRELIERVLLDIFGHPILIKAIVAESPQAVVKQPEDTGLESILEHFGGQLID